MSNYNSPSSFREEEIFFWDIPESWNHPSKALQDFRDSLEKQYNLNKLSYESVINEDKSSISSVEDQIKLVAEEVERLKEKRSLLSTGVMQQKLSLNELSLKKKSLEENNFEGVSEEEITEILKKVVSLEKENEIKLEEMKKKKKIYVGQMCFFKEYLDVYVDITSEVRYTLYFRSTRGKDKIKPKEWISIYTDNFKEYHLASVSLPEGSNEKKELMELVEKGIPLRQLIYKARKYCLSY